MVPKNNGQGSKSKSATATGLTDLFIHQLKDMYWAEKALVKAMPKMISNATASKLKTAIDKHLSETEKQVTRLEEAFESLEMKPEAEKCEAMAGLIKEAEEIMKATEEGDVRDAGIIVAAQKVEHYEIATYGSLCVFADMLGHTKALKLLKETLNEEKKCDKQLTQLAESSVNEEALSN